MSKRILIVDDEPNVRLNFRVTLETDGFFVTEAGNAAAALEQLAQNSFDLITLDLRMPEMGGLALLAEIRERKITTPVIIITAHGDLPNAVNAMRLGAIDFLGKPTTPDQLRAAVLPVLARHSPAPAAAPAGKAIYDVAGIIAEAKRLINLHDFAGAKEHLVHALELDDRNVEALNLAGVLLEMQEDYARAKKYYGRAIRIDSHYGPAQQNMRRIYELFNFGSSEEPMALDAETN